MLNQATIARPYARAAFEAACQQGTQARWSEALVAASAVVHDEQARRLVRHPRVEQAQVLELFSAIGGEAFDDAVVNFLRILMHYGRIDLLPEIAAQFEVLRAESEQRIKVRVTSAIELDADQQSRLRERLKVRFGRDVDLDHEIDPELIGGLMIHAGDQVIDGSVRGRLSRLANEISE